MSPVTSRSDAEDLRADGRDGVRRRVVEAAAELLDRSGSNAVTTRAVATAAGV